MKGKGVAQCYGWRVPVAAVISTACNKMSKAFAAHDEQRNSGRAAAKYAVQSAGRVMCSIKTLHRDATGQCCCHLTVTRPIHTCAALLMLGRDTPPLKNARAERGRQR